jgi:hypothetical protein
MTQQATSFGSRKPLALWQSLINLAHDNKSGLISRIVAPLARKLIVKKTSRLRFNIEANTQFETSNIQVIDHGIADKVPKTLL